MESLPLFRRPAFSLPTQNAFFQSKTLEKTPRFRTFCNPLRSRSIDVINRSSKSEYKPGVLDNFLLAYFRRKMVEELGWDSEKPGYHGLIEVVNRLMAKGKTNLETQQAAVRVLLSLFPPFLVENFQKLIAPIGGGTIAAMMVGMTCNISFVYSSVGTIIIQILWHSLIFLWNSLSLLNKLVVAYEVLVGMVLEEGADNLACN